VVRAKTGERCGVRKAGQPQLGGMVQESMEGADEDTSEPHTAFWRGELGKFLYAKTEEEAVSALAGALASDVPMPDWFRRVLAAMLENGGVVDGEMSWTIKVVRRRDTKHVRGMLAVYAQCKEIGTLIEAGMSQTAACRRVAEQCGKTQRSVEMAYGAYRERLDMMIGESKRRAEAAMARSKTLRDNLGFGSHREDD
jgi:hypothetical protein